MSKIQNLKAIHNYLLEAVRWHDVVSDVKDTKFESNSQQAADKFSNLPPLGDTRGSFGLKTKNPDEQELIEVLKSGGYLLSHTQGALPSARLGLTSLFGMGRGGTPAP